MHETKLEGRTRGPRTRIDLRIVSMWHFSPTTNVGPPAGASAICRWLLDVPQILMIFIDQVNQQASAPPPLHNYESSHNWSKIISFLNEYA